MHDAALSPSESHAGQSVEALIAQVAAGVRAGEVIPYLGPGILACADDRAPVPVAPEAVAFELNRRAPAPGRIRSDMGAVAQYIEQRRHRKTLVSLMAQVFEARVAPTPLHQALARLEIPLIVDTWYDDAMRNALAERTDWVEIQGVARALEDSDVWFRSYGSSGEPCPIAAVGAARTLLYKPHGAAAPARNFLVADSDYVEVLTEIDIQSPIPDVVKTLRTERGFAFIGCRFHDQMLRTYARQIAKRSRGPYFVFVNEGEPTRNEIRFFAEIGAILIEAPESRLLDYLEA
ncbi:MAG: SIR2 family NAD-dependent protein deacylase [Roseiarcus sp.]